MSFLSISEIILKLTSDPNFEQGIPIKEIKDVDLIRGIQTKLKEAGYFLNVDGIVGEQTYSAWVQFKQDNHQINPELVGHGSLTLLEKKITYRGKTDKNPSNLLQNNYKIFYELTPQRSVFLDLIAWCEGTDQALDGNRTGYDILYSFKRLSDYGKNYRDHPMVRIRAGGITSSAAGRYQIMDFTWNTIQRALSLPSFEPVYQDQAALWLLHVKRKALKFVDTMDLWNFCQVCSWEWASIPPNRYGQGVKSYQQIRQTFKKLCGVYGLDV